MKAWTNNRVAWMAFVFLAAGDLLLFTPAGRVVLNMAGLWLMTVAIHEGGHLVAALCLRFRVSSVRIGPIEIMSGYRGWRVRMVGPELGGHVEAWPLDHRYAPGREAVFTIAGPLANLGAMFALHGLYLLLGAPPIDDVGVPVRHFLDPPDSDATMVRNAVGSFAEHLAMWSGVIGLANLIPIWGKPHPTDGARLLGLVWRSWTIGRR
jgi:hypothetical protein